MSGIKDAAFGDRPFAAGYPDAPGWKAPGPSQAAATQIAPLAKDIRGKLLEVFKSEPAGLTTDQAARRIGMEPWRARPRVAELHRLGELRDSGKTRKGESGIAVTVWVPSPPVPWEGRS